MKSQEEMNKLLVSQISELKKSLNDRPSRSGTLPSNMIANPRGDVKAITTRSGVSYKGPTAPSTYSPIKVEERETEATTDTVLPTNNGGSNDVPPPVIPVPILKTRVIFEPPETPVENPKPNPKPSIPYPSRLQDQKLCKQIIKWKNSSKFFKTYILISASWMLSS